MGLTQLIEYCVSLTCVRVWSVVLRSGQVIIDMFKMTSLMFSLDCQVVLHDIMSWAVGHEDGESSVLDRLVQQ